MQHHTARVGLSYRINRDLLLDYGGLRTTQWKETLTRTQSKVLERGSGGTVQAQRPLLFMSRLEGFKWKAT